MDKPKTTPVRRRLAQLLGHLALACLLLALPLQSSAALAAGDDGPDIRHNIVLPAKPASKHELHVCARAELPDCLPSVAAALTVAPRDFTRIVVHCGHYRGDTYDLSGFSNLVIEGLSCPNGHAPVLDADGAATLRLGAFPWLGTEGSRNLWIENLELHASHVGGTGTPFRLGGSGFAMFRNVHIRENDNGLVVDPLFTGTVYIVDSLFRDNGYGRRGRTHHVNAQCGPPCRLVVLDSYFGKVLQGGDHLHVRGDVYAVGNMFIDEVGGIAAHMISTEELACAIGGAIDPPCLVARNFMLKNEASENREFIAAAGGGQEGTRPQHLVIRDNAAVGLRYGSTLVGNKVPDTRLVLRGNVLVVKDPARCGGTGARCLLTVPELGATLEGNRVSGDPDDVPTLFAGRHGDR